MSRPHRMPELSPLQKKMYHRLKVDERIYWTATKGIETHSLTSLVKRGLVAVHELDANGNHNRRTYWTLK